MKLLPDSNTLTRRTGPGHPTRRADLDSTPTPETQGDALHDISFACTAVYPSCPRGLALNSHTFERTSDVPFSSPALSRHGSCRPAVGPLRHAPCNRSATVPLFYKDTPRTA